MSSFCRFSGRLSVLNIAGTQTAFHNIVLPFLSSPPSVFFSHPRPASISDGARSADRRRARGHRLCAPLFTFCLTSEWKKGQSPPPPASASPHPREATKPKKCCPQAVCVFRWRSASNRSTRSNVVYDAPPPLSSQVHFGHATKETSDRREGRGGRKRCIRKKEVSEDAGDSF